MIQTHGRVLVPEVMQTSLMDCGPAALKAVLEGFGIAVDYDALRERCETDVDGTSIDALAELGAELGLTSHEVLVARDSFLLPEARCLPAIVVTRSGGGPLHFIVVWSTWGPFVQIMDPGSGRRWLRKQRFLEMLPELPIPISIAKWRKWAATDNALAPLRARMRAIGIYTAKANALFGSAEQDPSWHSFAALDAGVRMATALVKSRALGSGAEAARLLEGVLRPTSVGSPTARAVIPKRFWWANEDDRSLDKLVLRGAVIVHFAARSPGVVASTVNVHRRAGVDSNAPADDGASIASADAWPADVLPDALKRELAATTLRPMRSLWQVVRFDSQGSLRWLVAAMIASAALVPGEALLLRAVLSAHHYLALDYQRAAGVAAVLVLIAALLALDLSAAAAIRRIGLGLELRFRVAFLEKLPLLPDKYLRSRPSSDMAGRGHAMHRLRGIPALWAQAARGLLTLLATATGLIWLYPGGALWTVLLASVALVAPSLARRSLGESGIRLRTHGSALDRFYLDALLGVTPIWVHGAERAVRCEHEKMLTEWARTARSMHVQGTGLQALQLFASTSIAVALVASYVRSGGDVSGILLLAFWALRMPAAAQELVIAQLALRSLRSVALRLLAPLAASEAESALADASRPPAPAGESRSRPSQGVRLRLDRVTVRVGGHTLLQEISAEIPSGSHVAIVGASGAGKSSLLGLFLGWLTPSEGSVAVDGEPLNAERLARLREETAWADPAVRLWEQSLYDNVVFGDDGDAERALPAVIACADLFEVLGQLPEGMQADLGEGGVRVSGGQGQRVRLGRALMRERARLVILDEPFRGLERARRREMLGRVREHWPRVTLLFVSHDITDTLDLDRVLVLDAGRIVEDGVPSGLMADPCSRYAALVRAEQALRTELWSAAQWRRQSIQNGRLLELERT
jgi:ABC-type bacteriocin/lantibiotic exporter with double-glycine peptidase domain